MKNLFLTEEEKSTILEKHKNAILKEHHNTLLVEQTKVPILNVLSNPGFVNFTKEPLDSKDKKSNDSNIIYLSQVDKNYHRIPNSTFSYKIGGTYKGIDFDLNLRKVWRGQSGNLHAEVQPTNWFVKTAMTTLIPEKNLTKDGWLVIEIPVKSVNDAITELRNKKGSSAVMAVPKQTEIQIKVTQV